MHLSRQRDGNINRQHRVQLAKKIIRIGRGPGKPDEHGWHVGAGHSFQQPVKSKRHQARLIDGIQRKNRATWLRSPVLKCRLDLRQPRSVLVHRLKLNNASTRGRFDKIADWNNHRVKRDAWIGQDLVDDLVRPRRLDHIGQITRCGGDWQILKSCLSRIVPVGGIAILGEMRFQPEPAQVLDKHARAGASRSRDQKMTSRLMSLRSRAVVQN